MRSTYLIALLLTLPTIANCSKNVELNTLEKKASYSIGVDFITRMNDQGAEMDVDALIYGLKDASAGNKAVLTDEEMMQAKQEFQKKIQTALIEKQKVVAAENIKAGSDFLKANASKEGVITTESGLQYKVINKGKGAKPKLEDTVVTQYEGRLITGEVFDSSYKRNQPATFPVKGVIKGWTEALQLMPVGAKWQLFIPADIAYGASQRGPLIQPNSTLVFDIELLEIKAAK
ncbi:MAG: FKBP-type peptidyl-prolyl cis-trans isomerase [Gammaproteobacteria bacterium]